jgi:protein-disulfide isomerase
VPPKNTKIDITNRPANGRKEATVALVEFGDYECPFCAKHAADVAPNIESEFISTGKVRHFFVNNPLPSHPAARDLATAALCAGEQDQYWKMNRLLYKSKPRSITEILGRAQELAGLDAGRFEHCLTSQDSSHLRGIDSDVRLAQELNLVATPSFGIGRIETNQVVIDRFIVGAQPYSIFKEALTSALEMK